MQWQVIAVHGQYPHHVPPKHPCTAPPLEEPQTHPFQSPHPTPKGVPR